MFDRSKVTAVYSGRKGCACGCKGKYHYASIDHATAAEYVNPKSMQAMVTKIERMLADPTSDIREVVVEPSWFGVDMTHDRMYTIYF